MKAWQLLVLLASTHAKDALFDEYLKASKDELDLQKKKAAEVRKLKEAEEKKNAAEKEAKDRAPVPLDEALGLLGKEQSLRCSGCEHVISHIKFEESMLELANWKEWTQKKKGKKMRRVLAQACGGELSKLALMPSGEPGNRTYINYEQWMRDGGTDVMDWLLKSDEEFGVKLRKLCTALDADALVGRMDAWVADGKKLSRLKKPEKLKGEVCVGMINACEPGEEEYDDKDYSSHWGDDDDDADDDLDDNTMDANDPEKAKEIQEAMETYKAAIDAMGMQGL